MLNALLRKKTNNSQYSVFSSKNHKKEKETESYLAQASPAIVVKQFSQIKNVSLPYKESFYIAVPVLMCPWQWYLLDSL